MTKTYLTEEGVQVSGEGLDHLREAKPVPEQEMIADFDLSPEAVETLAKMADMAEKAAVNAERMCELLRPEFDAFEARTGHNAYVVRDYVDHRNAAQRQRKEAFAIRALTAENARLRAERNAADTYNDLEWDGDPVNVEKTDRRQHFSVVEQFAVRWEPYKPDGQRQMKAKGRWQRQVWRGDFFRWENCDRPDVLFPADFDWRAN